MEHFLSCCRNMCLEGRPRHRSFRQSTEILVVSVGLRGFGLTDAVESMSTGECYAILES